MMVERENSQTIADRLEELALSEYDCEYIDFQNKVWLSEESVKKDYVSKKELRKVLAHNRRLTCGQDKRKVEIARNVNQTINNIERAFWG